MNITPAISSNIDKKIFSYILNNPEARVENELISFILKGDIGMTFFVDQTTNLPYEFNIYREASRGRRVGVVLDVEQYPVRLLGQPSLDFLKEKLHQTKNGGLRFNTKSQERFNDLMTFLILIHQHDPTIFTLEE